MGIIKIETSSSDVELIANNKNKRRAICIPEALIPIVLVLPFTIGSVDLECLNILLCSDLNYLVIQSKGGVVDVSSLSAKSDLYRVASDVNVGSFNRDNGGNFVIVLRSSDSSVLFSKIPITKDIGYTKIERTYKGGYCDKHFSGMDLFRALSAPSGQLKNIAIFINKLNTLGYYPDIVSLEFSDEVLKGIYMVN